MKQENQKNTVVHSQKEYDELVKTIREQGGQVTHTFAIKDDGLSVQYRIPVEMEVDR